MKTHIVVEGKRVEIKQGGIFLDSYFEPPAYFIIKEIIDADYTVSDIVVKVFYLHDQNYDSFYLDDFEQDCQNELMKLIKKG